MSELLLDLARVLLAVGSLAALGWVVDRALVRFEPSGARWPLRMLLAIAAVSTTIAQPIFAALAVGAVGALRLEQLRARRAEERAAAPMLTGRGVAIVVVIMTALVASRPPAALYWDELVWLAKARLAAPDPRFLVAEALRAGTNVMPLAYPLLHPIAVALLGGLSTAPRAAVLGSEALTIGVGSLFVLLALESAATTRVRRALGIAALVAATPLVLVHLRSAYVDLETGMLAASLALALERRHVRSAAVIAVLLVGLKDEGIAHVLAVTAAFVIANWRRERPKARSALVALGAGAAAFVAWRIRVHASHAGVGDHTIGLPHIARVGLVLSLLLRQATDLVSWGPLWVVTGGLVLAVAARFVRLDVTTRRRLGSLALQALFLFGAIVAGSDRVAAFAESGTLVPRLLVQLAPMALLLVAGALALPPQRRG